MYPTPSDSRINLLEQLASETDPVRKVGEFYDWDDAIGEHDITEDEWEWMSLNMKQDIEITISYEES